MELVEKQKAKMSRVTIVLKYFTIIRNVGYFCGSNITNQTTKGTMRAMKKLNHYTCFERGRETK